MESVQLAVTSPGSVNKFAEAQQLNPKSPEVLKAYTAELAAFMGSVAEPQSQKPTF